uniref:Uncharacterized protein n=1 Tax=Anguilla anguilla TaxID=7936 RepID=A0A0E9STI2_ANGAN
MITDALSSGITFKQYSVIIQYADYIPVQENKVCTNKVYQTLPYTQRLVTHRYYNLERLG